MNKHYKAGVGFLDPEWKQIEDLKEALLKYGTCTPKCSRWWSHSNPPMKTPECDCGWVEDQGKLLYTHHTTDCNQGRFLNYKKAEGRECDCGHDDPAHRH